MTDKKPGLIEAGLEFVDKCPKCSGFPDFVKDGLWERCDVCHDFREALSHAKEREALVEAVVSAARSLLLAFAGNLSTSGECADAVDSALAALDRFDAGEGK